MFNIDDYMPLLKEIQASNGPVGASSLCKRASLKMSQATIGRQLAILEKEGILVKVANKGRVLTEKGLEYIKNRDISNTKSKIAEELVNISFLGKKETLIEIMKIRELLEPYTAAAAAVNATEDDIIEIENLAFAHRYALSREKLANEEDLGFHLTIARIGGNQTLYKILQLLLTDNNAYIEFSKAGDAQRDLQVKHHFSILNAIKNKDPKASEAAMREHLKNVFEDVIRVFKD